MGDGDNEVAGVALIAVAANQTLLLQGAEHRCEGAGIQIEQLAHLFAADLAVLPDNEHGEGLGIGKVNVGKKRLGCTDDFLGAGIEREAM